VITERIQTSEGLIGGKCKQGQRMVTFHAMQKKVDYIVSRPMRDSFDVDRIVLIEKII